MKLYGLNKTTLLDYPNHIACTVFCGHCNFRCPFCHNADLVLNPASQPPVLMQDFFAFLRKRKNTLEGVCITGGEPTLEPDLLDFIRSIKELGLSVKLDTNGYRPDVLESLLSQQLLDYVAMDIKSSREGYALASGLENPNLSMIEASVQLLKQSNIPYEFRTTVVKELHSREDFLSIARWIKGCQAYYLQPFRESASILYNALPPKKRLPNADTLTSYTAEELNHFIKELRESGIPAQLRGLS